jgi:hypothetical protein
MRIAERKLAELQRKLAGITAEFDWWLADAGEKRPLRKHQSQITRLTNQLRGLADRVEAEIERARRDGGDVLATSRDLQLRILEVHRLWDFFRSKLSLRYVSWFGPYLAVADEFAWACYRPALDQDRRAEVPAAAVKAAPLVFLSGEFSPFTHVRASPFDVEDVEGALDSADFLQVLYALPVPVIGLPWSQVAHLPDVVAIAHEVGHDVARDFGLTSATETHLRAATSTLPGPRRKRWFGWLPEIVADLYGILSVGPAFGSALTDLLAADPALIAVESADPTPARHPPATLRIELAAQALEQTGFPRAAAAQREAWTEAYGRSGPTDPFLTDAKAVVRELLDGKYPQFGDQKLRSVVTFSDSQQEDADAAAEAILGGLEPASDDIRCLVAAAQLAFNRAPERYDAAAVPGAKTAQELLLERVTATLNDRPRASHGEPEPASDEDREAGADLFDRITSLARQRQERR